MTTTIVKDAAGLTAALKSAQAGDVIKLAPGEYSPVGLLGLKFNGMVTVTSLDPSRQAELTGLIVKNCEGLKFQGLEFSTEAAKTDYPFQVFGSKNIALDGLNVHGSMDGDETNDMAALMVRLSDNVTVTNSEFQQLRHGVAHLDSKNVTISGNNFHDIQTDGVRGGGSSHVTIKGNFFSSFHDKEGDHPDAIQFWTTNTTTAATDIVVSDNVIVRGDGDAIQGIFLRDQVGGLEYERVTISGNLIVGGMYNGISVAGAKNLVITDNTVAALPDQPSWIAAIGATGVTMHGNVSTQYVLENRVENLVQTNDVTIAVPTDGGAALQREWLANYQGDLKALLVGTTTTNVSTLTPEILDAAAAEALAEMNALRAVAVTVTGTSGNESLKADVARDSYVDAQGGNDILYGGGIGHNTLAGGAGDDSYYVKSTFDLVVEGAGAGTDTVITTVDFSGAANVENFRLTGEAYYVAGNDLANKMTGSDLANELRGMGGDDVIQALGGNDKVHGGDGADQLVGGLGNDTLSGDAGNDKLVADEGNDSLVGGSGSDTLEGRAGSDTMSGGTGADTFLFRDGDLTNAPDRVLDFSRLDGDKISLQGIDANTKVAADQKFAFIGTQGFHKVAGELRMDVTSTETKVYGDVDGDGLADFTLVMPGVGTLQATDFLL